MMTVLSDDKQLDQSVVKYLILFACSTLSLALLVAACACCHAGRRKRKRISGDNDNATLDEKNPISPVPTVIHPEYYKRHPDAAQQQKASELDQLPKKPDLDRQENKKTNVDQSGKLQPEAGKKTRESAPGDRHGLKADVKSSTTTKTAVDTQRSKQKTDQPQKKPEQTVTPKTAIEFASNEDPAYMTLGLDVDDPFTLRPLEAFLYQPIIKPVPKTVLTPAPKREKSSVFV